MPANAPECRRPEHRRNQPAECTRARRRYRDERSRRIACPEHCRPVRGESRCSTREGDRAVLQGPINPRRYTLRTFVRCGACAGSFAPFRHQRRNPAASANRKPSFDNPGTAVKIRHSARPNYAPSTAGAYGDGVTWQALWWLHVQHLCAAPACTHGRLFSATTERRMQQLQEISFRPHCCSPDVDARAVCLRLVHLTLTSGGRLSQLPAKPSPFHAGDHLVLLQR